jgi:hypothetical protein
MLCDTVAPGGMVAVMIAAPCAAWTPEKVPPVTPPFVPGANAPAVANALNSAAGSLATPREKEVEAASAEPPTARRLMSPIAALPALAGCVPLSASVRMEPSAPTVDHPAPATPHHVSPPAYTMPSAVGSS